jgi:disulfide bond formation protein DsbB
VGNDLHLRAGLGFTLLLSAGLWLGALGFQYWGGLAPCEMCLWQRMPHKINIATGLAGLLLVANGKPSLARWALALAMLVFVASAGLGLMHMGVEQGWWRIETSCTADTGFDLGAMMTAPVVRCDSIPWSLLGISMAGYNMLISLAAAFACLWCLRKAAR